jgi:hypothetical protein
MAPIGRFLLPPCVVACVLPACSGKLTQLPGEPRGLAVNDTRVVWTTPADLGDVLAHTLTEVVDIKDLSGFSRLGRCPNCLPSGGVAIDAEHGYWAEGEKFNRNVLTAQIGDYQTITVAPGAKAITAFAMNATRIYGAAEDGRLFMHSLLPAADPNDEATIVPPLLVARDQGNVTSVVLNATQLFWVTNDCLIRSTAL